MAVETHPVADPHAEGFLEVGDGHSVYWCERGAPDGVPVVLLHGGPGQGSAPGPSRLFDPTAYRIVQFDQRGCGRSTPPTSDPATKLTANTTHHLIADIELLREHLGIDRWVVWGGSWGVTLGLAYAERFPQQVRALVLVAITVTRPQDVHWLYHEAGRFFPLEWDRFRAGVPAAERDGDLVAAYDHLLNHCLDPAVRAQAAQNWCDWEDAVLSLEAGWEPWDAFRDADFRMTFARTCAHYFSHAAWLAETPILENAHSLRGIPGVAIHGRFDIGGPPDVAYELSLRWPDAELHLVRAGHTSGDEMTRALLDATARFARQG